MISTIKVFLNVSVGMFLVCTRTVSLLFEFILSRDTRSSQGSHSQDQLLDPVPITPTPPSPISIEGIDSLLPLIISYQVSFLNHSSLYGKITPQDNECRLE